MVISDFTDQDWELLLYLCKHYSSDHHDALLNFLKVLSQEQRLTLWIDFQRDIQRLREWKFTLSGKVARMLVTALDEWNPDIIRAFEQKTGSIPTGGRMLSDILGLILEERNPFEPKIDARYRLKSLGFELKEEHDGEQSIDR